MAQWGFIKHKMGEFSREYGSKVKKAKLLLKSKLEKEIQTLSKNLNETNKLEYLSLQMQLNEIIENKIKGSILCSFLGHCLVKLGKTFETRIKFWEFLTAILLVASVCTPNCSQWV